MNEETDGLFSRVEHNRTADGVVHQIETLILDGVLRDGDRLPGERDLAQRLDVSRPILREALKELEGRGLLASTHGGGTYVADIVGEIFSKPLVELIARHERATQDYLDYRREMEGLTAELAARRATPGDRAILTAIAARMRGAHESGSFEEELAADIELHNAIGEAAHNIMLMHTLRACYRLLAQGIFYHRQLVFDTPGAREQLLSQHIAICEAILAGDPGLARRAAEDHIDYIVDTMRGAQRNGEWTRVSRLRLLQRSRDQG